jgi:4-hydroxybenzoate polyprenyltransferase
MLFYAIYMLIWLLTLMKYAPSAIVFIVFLTMSVQVFWYWQLIRTRSREGCFQAFRMNHWLGFTMFVGVVLGLSWQAL